MTEMAIYWENITIGVGLQMHSDTMFENIGNTIEDEKIQ
jgi:hypothetical protein